MSNTVAGAWPIVLVVSLFQLSLAWGEEVTSTKSSVNALLDNADAIKEGRRHYRQVCIICHLKAGGRGPNLFRTKLTPADFLKIVLNGRKDSQMPAFRDRLSNENIWQLHAFVMSRDRY